MGWSFSLNICITCEASMKPRIAWIGHEWACMSLNAPHPIGFGRTPFEAYRAFRVTMTFMHVIPVKK